MEIVLSCLKYELCIRKSFDVLIFCEILLAICYKFRRKVSFRGMIKICFIVKTISAFDIKEKNIHAVVIWHYSQPHSLIILYFPYIQSCVDLWHGKLGSIIHKCLCAGWLGNILTDNGILIHNEWHNIFYKYREISSRLF